MSKHLAVLFILLTGQAHADQLVYVSLTEPCRIVETRSAYGGTGLISQLTTYTYGTSTSAVMAQNGKSGGCGIPVGATAIGASILMLDASSVGDVRAFSIGTSPPNASIGVFNPGGMLNNAFTNLPLDGNGNFKIYVSGSTLDLIVDVQGYWLPVSWGEARIVGVYANALGYGTVATGYASTALGRVTLASGAGSTAMGHFTNATGTASTAMGFNANATQDYSYVWNGDSNFTHTSTTSPAPGSYLVYAPGGIFMYSGNYGSGGCVMANPGSAGWACSSDRDLKTGITPVDSRAVLEKVVAMPVSTWSFKTAPDYKHIGPMAQDFKAAFGLGDADDKHISAANSQGVALAAIQGLNTELMEHKAKLAEKDTQIAALRTEVEKMKTLSFEVAEMKAQLAARVPADKGM